MSLLLPDSGLLFWMLLAFGIVFFVLYKYGFPVIVSMVDARKKYIDDALKDAKKAKAKFANVEQQCNELVESAQKKQSAILREAMATKEQIIKEARDKAEAETEKIIADARRLIEQEKDEALKEIRDEVARLSIVIAEKIVRKELSTDEAHRNYIDALVDEALDERKAKDNK